MMDQALISQSTQLDALIDINIHDLLVSFGLENLNQGRRALEIICKPPARRFAHQMVAFDCKVGEQGLHSASYDTLKNYVYRMDVEGLENIPESGPVLVLSNHPGMTDTLALFSSLPRVDLRAVAAERPFLQSLSNVGHYLIYVPDGPGKRMSVVRSAVSHLRKGGAILTFPAGEIEPDPACMPGATASLGKWSESVAIFARLVPEVQIVTAIVSGVIWSKTMNHPFTHLRHNPKDRERLGAALQVLFQTILPYFRPVTIRVIYGEPLLASDLLAQGDPAAIMRAVTAQARQLIEHSKTPPKSE
jgi:1-acyl-sn-glycerol-3-phosphate acyltransferase